MTGQLWNESRAEIAVLDEFLHQPLRRLSDGRFPEGPGAYGLFMERPPLGRVYRRLRGCAWMPYIGAAKKDMPHRLGRHFRNLGAIPNLAHADFWVATIPLPSAAAALYAEALLIAALQPVWSTVLPGLSSVKQGGSRAKTQRVSRHAILHPGPYSSHGTSPHTAAELATLVERHLDATVPAGTSWSRIGS